MSRKAKFVTCILSDCAGKYYCKGYCNKHYLRWSRYGRLSRKNRVKPVYVSRINANTVVQMHKIRFGGLRELVIQRDGEACVSCGMTRKVHKDLYDRDITVNHIDGRGRYAEIPHNEMDNLETLCLRCHGRKDSLRYWSEGVII